MSEAAKVHYLLSKLQFNGSNCRLPVGSCVDSWEWDCRASGPRVLTLSGCYKEFSKVVETVPSALPAQRCLGVPFHPHPHQRLAPPIFHFNSSCFSSVPCGKVGQLKASCYTWKQNF